MTHSGPTISHQLHNQANYHRRIWRAIKVFERFNIALRLRGRYTLLLGLGRYHKSIYVNPLGRKPPCIRGVGCKAALAWSWCKLGYHADAGRSDRLGVASAAHSRLLGAQHPGVGNGMSTGACPDCFRSGAAKAAPFHHSLMNFSTSSSVKSKFSPASMLPVKLSKIR